MDTEWITALVSGLGPVGAAVVILGAWWIYNNKQASKRESETPSRATTAVLVERFADVDRHVRTTREEVQEVASTVHDLARTAERIEGESSRTLELCLASKTILEEINRRLDRQGNLR